jgi:hypothetical protein
MRTWPGLLLVPLIALAHLSLNYALVPWSCSMGRAEVLHWIALASLGSAITITLYQWRAWRRSATVMAGNALVSRLRFTAGVSTLTGTFFTLVILAMWSAQWIVPPCAS